MQRLCPFHRLVPSNGPTSWAERETQVASVLQLLTIPPLSANKLLPPRFCMHPSQRLKTSMHLRAGCPKERVLYQLRRQLLRTFLSLDMRPRGKYVSAQSSDPFRVSFSVVQSLDQFGP